MIILLFYQQQKYVLDIYKFTVHLLQGKLTLFLRIYVATTAFLSSKNCDFKSSATLKISKNILEKHRGKKISPNKLMFIYKTLKRIFLFLRSLFSVTSTNDLLGFSSKLKWYRGRVELSGVEKGELVKLVHKSGGQKVALLLDYDYSRSQLT